MGFGENIYKLKNVDKAASLYSNRSKGVVLTAKGEVHTHEAAQVFVHDLNASVTVQLLEEMPAVLSL